MKCRKLATLLSAILLTTSGYLFADDDAVLLADRVKFERPVGWDLTKDENDSVLLKPLGVSGVGLLKLWRYPKNVTANFPTMFDDSIELALWQEPWSAPTFWLTEPMSENQLRYTNVSTSHSFSGIKEWACTRHYGSHVRDLVDCYTFIDGGILAATYISANTTVSDDDAVHTRDEVIQVLNGIHFPE